MNETVQWNIEVSSETDHMLRTFLRARGMKEADVAKFIEDATLRRVLQCTVQDIREGNAAADPDEIQLLVDQTVSEVRAARRAERKG